MPLVNRTFDQLIDFTRTSAGTFVNSSGNIASTAQSRNLLTFTQEFDNAAWTKTSSTITANSTTAPDGTFTADTFIETAATDRHVVNSSGTVTTAVHVFSVYFKKGTGATAPNWVQLYTGGISAQYANFNLGTGAVGSVAAGSTGTITAVGNGWYRCTLSFTPSSGGAVTAAIAFTNNTDTTTRGLSYAGAVTSDVFIWGAQLEQASSATDYTRNFGGLFPPRFDYDPVTLQPRGLLIEEQRTNLLTYSAQFDNAAWTPTGATVSANTTAAPDGTVTADTLVEDTSAGVAHRVYATPSCSANTTYTFTAYVKAASRTEVRLLETTLGGAIFNLSTVAIVSTDAGVTASIQDAGNGWRRCRITNTTGAAQTLYVTQVQGSVAGNPTYTGNGAAALYLWGAQLEAGSFATSYIPTVAAQVTRTADVAAINAPNFASWYNQTAGTFVVEASFNSAPAAATFSLYSASDNTSNERIFVATGVGSGGNINAVVTDGGVLQAQTVNGGLSTAGAYKYANAYEVNDFASAANGGTVATDTAGTLPTVDRLFIGSSAIGTAPVNGHVRSIRYYPTRLSNAQLQALTA